MPVKNLSVNKKKKSLLRHSLTSLPCIASISACLNLSFFINQATAQTNTNAQLIQISEKTNHDSKITESKEETAFLNWVKNFKTIALKEGISKDIFDQAFKNVTLDRSILKHAQYQPEFTYAPSRYLNNHITKARINKGVELAHQWHDWLIKIQERFQVPYPYILAIWSMESSYGAVFKNKHQLKDAIRSLATLAYGDPRRKKYATTQLLAALKILQKGEIDRTHLLGSWAGALGHTQFIPTSYLLYGVDMDGDSKIDIWESIPDALATAANLLHKNGWRPNEGWGFEVRVPAAKNLPTTSQTLKTWHNLHITKLDGSPVEPSDQKANLKIFKDSGQTRAFLLTRNFFVIKAYNSANLYALSVGLLGDEIAKGIAQSQQDKKIPIPKIK